MSMSHFYHMVAFTVCRGVYLFIINTALHILQYNDLMLYIQHDRSMLAFPAQRTMINFATNLCLGDIKDNHFVCIHAASVTGNSATNGHSFSPYTMIYTEIITQMHNIGRVVITQPPSATIITTSWNTCDAARGGVGQIVCVMAPCHSSAMHWHVCTGVSGNFYWFTTNNTRQFKQYAHYDVVERDLLCRHVDLFNASPLISSDDGDSTADTLKTPITPSRDDDQPTTPAKHGDLISSGTGSELFIDNVIASILSSVNSQHPDVLVRKGNEVVYTLEIDDNVCTSISTGVLIVLKSHLIAAYDSMCDDNATTHIDDTHTLFPGIGSHDATTRKSYRLKLLQFGQFKKGSRVDQGMCNKVTTAIRSESLVGGISLFTRRCMCDMYVDTNDPENIAAKRGTPWIMWRDINASFVSAMNTVMFNNTADGI